GEASGRRPGSLPPRRAFPGRARACRAASRGMSGLPAGHRAAPRPSGQSRSRDRAAARGELGPLSRRATRQARRSTPADRLVAASDAARALGEPRRRPAAARGVGRPRALEEWRPDRSGRSGHGPGVRPAPGPSHRRATRPPRGSRGPPQSRRPCLGTSGVAVGRARIWLALGLLGAIGGGMASSSDAADGAAPPPDAQMLLDLDLLGGTDLQRERELYTRLPILEKMRTLESMPASETGPRPVPAPSEAKER